MADPIEPKAGEPEISRNEGKLIVAGVGASAGGLEAFTELLQHLPPTTGMAFVLVQHLDPGHESALRELLANKTEMPVLQVQNDLPIQPDHVYVIPPNTVMSVRNRVLKLEPRPSASEKFRPIDTFFSSLAEAFRSNAVGIVLSGTASDGTWGLKTIKAEGGITFAQNQTAKFDGMPRSAIAAGVVDFVLSPRRIAEELTSIANRTLYLGKDTADLAAGEGHILKRLLLLLRKNTGVDFMQYKQPTVLRRLRRRMVVRNCGNLEQYTELVQKEPDEAQALFSDLLINVTGFFRDPEVFESAARLAFPSLIRDPQSPRTIRAWVPGCSSGEEVYSLAICLTEYLESQDLDFAIQLFGTDISEAAIDKARAGVYDHGSVANVSPERLRRFFSRTEAGYQINRSIREWCIFSLHNVAKDPPLSRMDLISCRNLLIYFSPGLQRRVVSKFGYALQPSGCLILGPSETLGELAEFFLTLDEPKKIYCRKANIPQSALLLAEPALDYSPDYFKNPLEPAGAETAGAAGSVHRRMPGRHGAISGEGGHTTGDRSDGSRSRRTAHLTRRRHRSGSPEEYSGTYPIHSRFQRQKNEAGCHHGCSFYCDAAGPALPDSV
jgi:two-component system CheB/CheR fusion protein